MPQRHLGILIKIKRAQLDFQHLWKQNPEFSEFRARAQAARILALQKRKREAMEKKLDWKCVAWDLERIFRKQFALESASVSLNQTNNTLNLTDGQWLQEARDALDDVINVKEARRRQEEAEASIEKGHGAEPERQPASRHGNGAWLAHG
jgi:hypothetical protein